jgi:hypothetical protein
MDSAGRWIAVRCRIFVSLDSDPPDITAGNVCPDV